MRDVAGAVGNTTVFFRVTDGLVDIRPTDKIVSFRSVCFTPKHLNGISIPLRRTLSLHEVFCTTVNTA